MDFRSGSNEDSAVWYSSDIFRDEMRALLKWSSGHSNTSFRAGLPRNKDVNSDKQEISEDALTLYGFHARNLSI